MAEESVVSSSFSVILHPMESYLKKILPSTRRSLDPIKTNHWPGKIPCTENEDELDADGLSPGILQDRYERAETSQCRYYAWERLLLCLTWFVCLRSPLRSRSV